MVCNKRAALVYSYPRTFIMSMRPVCVWFLILFWASLAKTACKLHEIFTCFCTKYLDNILHTTSAFTYIRLPPLQYTRSLQQRPVSCKINVTQVRGPLQTDATIRQRRQQDPTHDVCFTAAGSPPQNRNATPRIHVAPVPCIHLMPKEHERRLERCNPVSHARQRSVSAVHLQPVQVRPGNSDSVWCYTCQVA